MTLPLTPARNLGRDDVALGPLRADVTDYGHNPIWLPPNHRRKRGALTPEELAEGVVSIPDNLGTALVTRTWPWHMSIAINTRSTLVSNQFSGPALIKRFRASVANAASPEGGLGILWATDDGGAQTSGAGANVPSGTPIFETISSPVGGVGSLDEFKQVFSELNTGVTESIMDVPLNYIVPFNGPFYLKLTGRALAGGGYDLKGFVTVLQGPTVEELLKYMQ